MIVVPALAMAAALSPSVSAKEFAPDDLRVCGVGRCVPVVDRHAVALLGPFYYGRGKLIRATAPGLGVPSFELRFTNGYATGIVATRRLDRFLSYGVNLGRFSKSTWYRVPTALAVELRRLAASLKPFPLDRAALRRSRIT